jgi:hypothetical protein
VLQRLTKHLVVLALMLLGTHWMFLQSVAWSAWRSTILNTILSSRHFPKPSTESIRASFAN